MKNKHRTNLNAYLFANLVILCILVVSLWNRKPVWDATLRFPNLLLILVILNSILIFKNLIFAKTTTKSVKKGAAGRTVKNLAALRGIVQDSAELDASIYTKVIGKLQTMAGAEAAALLLPENSYYKTLVSSGELPPAFGGARFQMREDKLMVKFPGNLGEEEIGKIASRSAAISFKSTVTRIEAIIYPLFLKQGQIGLMMFLGQESCKSPGLPFSSTALFLETLVTLVETASSSGDLRYKDKSTGLLKHDCFADYFETEIERSERYQQELSLFTVKIKLCQDTSAQDKAVLQKAAAVALKQSLRRLDLMFCAESDCEFFAILTETGAQVAEIVAQRVQKSFAKQIEKTNLDNKQRILFIGSASYPTHATHGHGVVEKSREALTQAENEDKDFVSYGHTD